MPFVLLENSVLEYAWGSTTAIPDLRGHPPTGRPQAELWIGAHPEAPSRVAETGERLDDAIASAPARWLGPSVAHRFEGKLPFLLKVLAAKEPLSIQCHPGEAQAQEGFRREEQASIPRDAKSRNYRDENPKPELLIAVSSFRALKGFRPTDEIVDLFRRLDLPELRPAVDALSDDRSRQGLQNFYANLMSRPDRERARLAERCLPHAACHPEAPAFNEVVRLAARYPGDLGALAPLYLNLINLRPMEGLFLGPGELHTYLEGLGVELMGNSDNVVRGGLTPKHVDVPELLRLLRFEAGPPQVLVSEPVGPGLRRFPPCTREFLLEVAEPQLERSVSIEPSASVRIALAMSGEVVLRSSKAEQRLKTGQSALLEPTPSHLDVQGTGRLFIASVPEAL